MANSNSPIKDQRFDLLNVKQGRARSRQAQDLSADGAIILIDGVVTLSKSTTGAYTIAAPQQSSNTGLLIITITTAHAHVITSSVDGFNAKGSSGTVTFGGAIGDSCILLLMNGHIYFIAGTNATVA